jgi:hypothetical protein
VDAITYWSFAERAADVNILGTALLTESLVPQPAYHALKSLVKDTWWTRFEAKTDGKGTLKAKMFYGDYELAVSVAGGSPQRLSFRVSPNARDITLTVKTTP